MAIVSPLTKPLIEIPPHTPLRAMDVQPVPQVAVHGPVPDSATALLVAVCAVLTFVWLVKVMAAGVVLPPNAIQLVPLQYSNVLFGEAAVPVHCSMPDRPALQV